MQEELTGELTGEAAAELLTGDPAAGGDPAAEDNKDKAFQAVAEDERAKRQSVEAERDRLADENRRYQEQLLVAANPSADQPPKDIFDGLENYENVTVEQARQLEQKRLAETNQLLTNIQLNNFITANPDFSEVVGTYGRNGQLISAEPLKQLIKENPQMRVLLTLEPSAAPYVYYHTKQHKQLKELQAQQAANAEHQAGVNVANKTGPLSPAALGGGGGAASGGSHKAEMTAVEEAQWEAAERGDLG